MLGVFRQQMQRCVANGARALDQTQVGYLQEQCVRVDENDNVVGHADKQHCHLWANIERGGWCASISICWALCLAFFNH
jgi:hypothetical protein